MNKTITITLAGFSIIIEEEAYQKLAQYLHALRNSLGINEADEIMFDIETRIVEILKEQLHTNKREVVTQSDIEHIITLIGTPEQINEQTEDNTEFTYTTKTKKVLFRNPDDKVFSGVASGLATYLGIRTIWMRLLLIVFSFTLITIVAYIALWILMPIATSTTDKLKMKGQPLNFENIKEQSLEFARKADQELSGTLDGLTPIMKNAADIIVKIVTTLFKFVRSILGIIFISFAICIIGSLVLGLSVAVTKDFSLFQNLKFYVENNFLIFCGFLGAFLWAALLISIFTTLGIKCLKPHKNLPHIGKIIGGLAISAFIVTMICVSFPIKIAAQEDRYWSEEKNEFTIPTTNDTLYVQKVDTTLSTDYKNYWGDIESNGKLIFKKHLYEIQLAPTDEKIAKMELMIGNKNTTRSSEKLGFPIQIVNNQIIIPSKYSFPIAQKLNTPYVRIKLLIPAHQTVKIKNDFHVNDDEMFKIDSIYNAHKTLKN